MISHLPLQQLQAPFSSNPSSFISQLTPISSKDIPFSTYSNFKEKQIKEYQDIRNNNFDIEFQTQQLLQNKTRTSENSPFFQNENYQIIPQLNQPQKDHLKEQIGYSVFQELKQRYEWENEQGKQYLATSEKDHIPNNQISFLNQVGLQQGKQQLPVPLDNQQYSLFKILNNASLNNFTNQKEDKIISPYISYAQKNLLEQELKLKLEIDYERIRQNLKKEEMNTKGLQTELNIKFRSLDALFESYDLIAIATDNANFNALQILNSQIQQNITIISNIQSEIHASQSRKFGHLQKNYCPLVIGKGQLFEQQTNQNASQLTSHYNQENKKTPSFEGTLSSERDIDITVQTLPQLNQDYSLESGRNSQDIKQLQFFEEVNQFAVSDHLKLNGPITLNHQFDKQQQIQNYGNEEKQLETIPFPYFSITKCAKLEEPISQLIHLKNESNQCYFQQNSRKKKSSKKQYNTTNVIKNVFHLLIKYLISLELDEGAEFREYLMHYSQIKSKNVQLTRSILRSYPLINEIEEISDNFLRKDFLSVMCFQRSKLPLIQQIKKINFFNSMIRTHSAQFITLQIPQIIQKNEYYSQKDSIQQFAQNLLSYIQNPNRFLRIQC